MQKSSCIPPPVPPPLCREQQGWYGKETREGLIHPITFSWWWQNSDPYRCDQQGKNNSLTLQQSNAQPLHGLVSTAGHESNICKYTQEWQNGNAKASAYKFPSLSPHLLISFPHWWKPQQRYLKCQLAYQRISGYFTHSIEFSLLLNRYFFFRTVSLCVFYQTSKSSFCFGYTKSRLTPPKFLL